MTISADENRSYARKIRTLRSAHASIAWGDVNNSRQTLSKKRHPHDKTPYDQSRRILAEPISRGMSVLPEESDRNGRSLFYSEKFT